MPFLRLNQSLLNREMLSGATEEQYGIIGRHRLAEMEDMDAYIEIRGGGTPLNCPPFHRKIWLPP